MFVKIEAQTTEPMSFTFHSALRKLIQTEPSIGASHQSLAHLMNRNLVGSNYGRSSIKIAHFIPIRLQTWSPQTILVSDWPISNKRPCLLTDRNEMSNLYRGPSIDASYQVLLYLVEAFQRRRLKCE
jgi:hypothetical protein